MNYFPHKTSNDLSKLDAKFRKAATRATDWKNFSATLIFHEVSAFGGQNDIRSQRRLWRIYHLRVVIFLHIIHQPVYFHCIGESRLLQTSNNIFRNAIQFVIKFNLRVVSLSGTDHINEESRFAYSYTGLLKRNCKSSSRCLKITTESRVFLPMGERVQWRPGNSTSKSSHIWILSHNLLTQQIVFGERAASALTKTYYFNRFGEFFFWNKSTIPNHWFKTSIHVCQPLNNHLWRMIKRTH